MKNYRTIAVAAVLVAALAVGLYLAFPIREPVAVPVAHLRGHWALDEPGGQRLDSSGLGNDLDDLTGVGTAPGRLGLAADFELADGDYLAVADIQGSLDITGSLTLAGWVNPESVLGETMIMAAKYEWGVANRAYRFGLIGDHLHFIVSPDGWYRGDYILDGQTPLGPGWRHVAAVFDAESQTMTLYVDGTLDATRTVGFNSINLSTAPFMLGANVQNGSAVQHLDGALDEWYVFARALSEEEIDELIALTVPDWEFVVDVEARNAEGEVLATRQVRASECQPDGQGGCSVRWDWGGEVLPEDASEWVKPYLLLCGYEIAFVHFPDWCQVDQELCQIEVRCDGNMIVAGPSAECLAELDSKCKLRPDERGFWPAGSATDGGAEYAFYEPLILGEEWHDLCPLPEPTPTMGTPPPTYTPLPTYTAEPTPTCRPTWTPWPMFTPYPPSTPYPTGTPYPDQPPWQ